MNHLSFNNWQNYSLFNKDQVAEIQNDFLQSWQDLHAQAQQGQLPASTNRRFRGKAWSQDQQALLQAHVWQLYGTTLERMAHTVTDSPQLQERLAFAVMQWVEALCPANFLLTNPDAMNKALETKGQSLFQGAQNFLQDLQKGRLQQTDESQFQVGENLATTPGAVVFQNELLQLIQYEPSQKSVHETPLFIVPPNINKYYILDLQPENSFVRHALDQGMQVFLISWRNPLATDDDGILDASWGDYLEHGILEAMAAAQSISASPQLNALGFCVGGTMLASALSLAKARGENPVHSLTLLTAMLDFYDVGLMRVFVDEASALLREWQLSSSKFMPASELATTFSFLRPSELVWNYVTNNYLKGETPNAFDILYWNADSTNLPGPFFTWYFRNTYLENNLKVPGKISVDGVPIDFSQLDMPTYLYASIDDHIVPWRTAYASTSLVPGVQRFVLGASGHIAGVINPPLPNRRHYWAYESAQPAPFPGLADEWLKHAPKHDGSWWGDWAQWLSQYAGNKKTAPKTLGNKAYPVLEAAPGSYVKTKAVA